VKELSKRGAIVNISPRYFTIIPSFPDDELSTSYRLHTAHYQAQG
jgi:hypothetical protein